jgi:hypothetical protein
LDDPQEKDGSLFQYQQGLIDVRQVTKMSKPGGKGSGQIVQAFQPLRVSTRQIRKSPLEQRNGFTDVADVAEAFKSVSETMGLTANIETGK